MIKRLNPQATFKLVSQYDDALLHETKEEVKALKETGEKTRYEKFLDSFNIDDLKFKDDAKPTYFIVRCLKADELAEIYEKYSEGFDPATKTNKYKGRNKMLIDMFNIAVLGVEMESAKVEKITSDELEFGVALEIGSLVSLMTTLRKNLKKQ